MNPLELHYTLSFRDFVREARKYFFWKLLPVFLLFSFVNSFIDAWLLSDVFPLGYWQLFVMLFLFFFAAPLPLLLWIQLCRQLEKVRCAYQEEYDVRIDFEEETFSWVTKTVAVRFHFSMFTGMRQIGNFLWLSRGEGILICIKKDCFPSSELYRQFKECMKAAIRNPKKPLLIAQAPQIPQKHRWRGYLIGCGVFFLLMLFAVVWGGYHAYRNMNAAPAVEEQKLSAAERLALEKAFARLDAALKAKAPQIHVKKREISWAAIQELRKTLGGKVVEPVEAWTRFFHGLEDCEIMPLGIVMGQAHASETYRAFNRMSKYLPLERVRSYPLLHDGSGDGYFLKLQGADSYVFYDMLETPGNAVSIGDMTDFIHFISDGIEQGIWTFGKDGKIEGGFDRFSAFRKKYEKTPADKKQEPVF